MSSQTKISGQVVTYDAAGTATQWKYRAKYTAPTFSGDMMSVDWSAEVEGLEHEHFGSSMQIRMLSFEVNADLLQKQVEVWLLTHLQARNR